MLNFEEELGGHNSIYSKNKKGCPIQALVILKNTRNRILEIEKRVIDCLCE